MPKSEIKVKQSAGFWARLAQGLVLIECYTEVRHAWGGWVYVGDIWWWQVELSCWNTYTYAYTRAYCIHTYKHANTHVHMRSLLHIQTYKHAYIHAFTCLHTYIQFLLYKKRLLKKRLIKSGKSYETYDRF